MVIPLWHIHALEYYAALEQNKVVWKVVMWEECQDIINVYYVLELVFKKEHSYILVLVYKSLEGYTRN